jgi:glycosyltransferase involved in cell wall biosynthesis
MPRAGPDHDFLMVVPPGDDYSSAAAANNCDIFTVDRSDPLRRSVWEVVRAGRLARSWGADWALSLGNVPVPFGSDRSAVLLHDPHVFYPMSHMGHLPLQVRTRKQVLRAYLRAALPRQKVVFVQTQVAASRVSETYRVGDIEIIPNALSALIGQSGSDDQSPPLPDADFRFLALTRYYRRKNLEVLVDVYEEHGDRLGGTVGLLTVDTKRHAGARALMDRVAALGLSDALVNLGPVDQRDLAGLYANIDAVVLPTLLESYSGTYVEAMALGVPIITSDRDFAHEVCGDAAVYVDPTDPAAVATAIASLADDPARQEVLIERGLARADAESATWDESAAAMLAALERRSARD